MKKLMIAVSMLGLLLAGCSTATEFNGDYKTPTLDVGAAVGFSTNGVDVSGSYDTTNQAVSGGIDFKK